MKTTNHFSLSTMDGSTPAAMLETIRHPDYQPEQQQYVILSMSNIKCPITYDIWKAKEKPNTNTL